MHVQAFNCRKRVTRDNDMEKLFDPVLVNSLWPGDTTWRHRTEIWVDICSGNGLLPDDTKPLSSINVDLSSKAFCSIQLREISQEVLMILGWTIQLETKCVLHIYIYSKLNFNTGENHYNDVIMTTIASQITSLAVVYSTAFSDADQRKHQSSASLAFVWGIHRGPVNSPHKGPVTRKMFPFDDIIMPWTLLKLPHLAGANVHIRS